MSSQRATSSPGKKDRLTILNVGQRYLLNAAWTQRHLRLIVRQDVVETGHFKEKAGSLSLTNHQIMIDDKGSPFQAAGRRSAIGRAPDS